MSVSHQKILLQKSTGKDKNKFSIFDSSILVVDDSILIRELIGACLTSAGYKNISFAEDGEKALAAIDHHIPDLIILDLEMPIMDGFEVCRLLRENSVTRNIPILIQSGRDTAADITRAFEYGASDMVVKPIKKYEIIARTKVHLENKIFVTRLQAFHDRVASELEQARKLQLDICPSPEEIENFKAQYGLDIGWHYEPSSELGGDIGGILPISDTQLAFYIADFSGHGVAAALNTFRMQTWLTSAQLLYAAPELLLEELNNFLHGNLAKGSYATMMFFCLDLEREELIYAAAGCQPPLLQNPDNSSEFTLQSSRGMPLGLRANWKYKSQKVPFGPGSKIILYSDALVEVEASRGQFLGDEGLMKEVNRHWHANISPTELINLLVSNFHIRLSSDEPDDLTVIYLENRKKQC